MSLTDAAKIAKSAGLFGQADDEFRQSWFSTLMGRTTQAVLLVFGYLAALGAIWGLFGNDLKNLHAEHPLIFWSALGGPLLLVLLFSVIPTIRRGIRERRLHPLATRQGEVREGYYRLRPYEEADAKDYTRPDGAVEEAVSWLKGATDTVLYLSGASGSGKTSLINAGVIPALRAEDWQIVAVRGMADPLGALRKSTGDPVKVADADRSTALEGLRALANHAETKGLGPILIVLDQFEEYLILDGGPAKEVYTEFLRELAANPIPNVRLLHVFREDYRALLFKEGFPDYLPRRTGFELAPLNRHEAEQFLRNGPQALDDRGYDALFAGLDRIEDARGIYRPITLNMIGYVLGQQGKTLSIDPGKLIETYLTDCIARGPAKDFTPAVLQSMITREGTKEPRKVETIAKITRVEPWQVKATLVDLENDRLVRPLPQGLWEISHDFLARLIGQVLGRGPKRWASRTATPALALALIGWITAFAIAVPAWNEYRLRAALDRLATLPVSRSQAADGGIAYRAEEMFSNWDLERFVELAGLLEITSLNLARARYLDDLSPLQGMDLTELVLTGSSGQTDLSPLQGMSLTDLFFVDAMGIVDLSPLQGMPLTNLHINFGTSITDLSPLQGMPLNKLYIDPWTSNTGLSILQGMPLTELHLDGATGITDLRPLKEMPLALLILSGTGGVKDLSPLKGMSLNTLILNGSSVANLSPLQGMPLNKLYLFGSTDITDLRPLKGMPLTSLLLTGADGITDLSPLKGMPLTSLILTGADGITNLSPLQGMKLARLDLSGAVGITSLSPLQGMPLTSLILNGADGITDLSPLRGIDPNVIEGANEELLRTLE